MNVFRSYFNIQVGSFVQAIRPDKVPWTRDFEAFFRIGDPPLLCLSVYQKVRVLIRFLNFPILFRS